MSKIIFNLKIEFEIYELLWNPSSTLRYENAAAEVMKYFATFYEPNWRVIRSWVRDFQQTNFDDIIYELLVIYSWRATRKLLNQLSSLADLRF